MGFLSGEIRTSEHIAHRPAWWIALLGLMTALAALAVPGPATDTTGIASILAVAAVAVFAGHAWGLLLVAAGDVIVLGKLWPLLAFGASHDPLTIATAGVAVVTALPGVALFGYTLPHLVDIILGGTRPRLRSAGIALGSLGALAWLTIPAWLLAA